jgi:tetratricopeptide (TPR) repeat protein
MAGNPRIEELRKRLEKEPASRLFAQLAEELRKDGELGEAIKLCRAGLLKHPSYPSARMTLGRALLDSGEMGSARQEFESVLKGAPDNILASRYLGESLEGIGDLPGAVERYKKTLLLAPGDKAITARLADLEARLAGPLAAAEAAGSAVDREGPIPLASVDSEEFELEAPFAAGGGAPPGGAGPGKPAEAEGVQAVAAPSLAAQAEVEWEAPGEAGPAAEGPGGRPIAEPEAEGPPDDDLAPAAAPGLVSATVGELYATQGHPVEAAAVYRELARREPANLAHVARAEELEAQAAQVPQLSSPPGLPEALALEVGPGAEPEEPMGAEVDREVVLRRTVDRLEGWLSVVRRGRQ